MDRPIQGNQAEEGLPITQIGGAFDSETHSSPSREAKVEQAVREGDTTRTIRIFHPVVVDHGMSAARKLQAVRSFVQDQLHGLGSLALLIRERDNGDMDSGFAVGNDRGA